MTTIAALTAATQLLFLDSGSVAQPNLHRSGTSPAVQIQAGSSDSAPTAVRGISSQDGPQSLVRVLDGFRKLLDNWDAQGARAPDHGSIDLAIAFLRAGPDPSTWEPTLHADGRVILEHESDWLYVELTFGPGDAVTYVRKERGFGAQVGIESLFDLLGHAQALAA